MKKFTSRKFIMLNICLFLAIAIPIGFQWLKIDTAITTTSLAIVGALSGVYFGVNVIEKRNEEKKE